jgi:hypothetical protein
MRMPESGKSPDRVHIGASVVLVSLSGLGKTLGIEEEHVRSLLGALEIPIIQIPGSDKRHFSLYALETALFQLGLPTYLKEAPGLGRVHQELAGVLYGTLKKEVVRERVHQLARALHPQLLKSGRKKKPRDGKGKYVRE